MYQFKIENPNQYDPTDTVRITITIEEGYDKQEVIDAVVKEMEGLKFELHNTKIYDKGFTANVQYSLIEKIEEVEGVESVSLSKRVDITTPSENEKSEEVIIQPNDKPDHDSLVVGSIGLIVVVMAALIIKKVRDKK